MVSRLGVYSCRRAPENSTDKTPIPDVKGNIFAYPFRNAEGKTVNVKYLARRGKQKLYFQTPKGEKIFYNLQAALDPILQDPDSPGLLIVEGENDCAAGLTAGHEWTIGVPDGGSPDQTETGKLIPMKPDEELDPDDDRKFEFIKNCWDDLEAVRKVVLWMDWDSVGQRLVDELSRRLGKVRCFVVRRPPHMHEAIVKATVKDKVTKEEVEITRPVKDLNEVLQYYGPHEVLRCIGDAKPIPMTGLYLLDDFEDRRFKTYSTGFKALDPHVLLYDTAFSVVSGLPQSGKSLLWNQIAYNMAELYGWRIALGSFEAPVKPMLVRQLRSFYIKKDRQDWTQQDVRDADHFIREHFVFICRDPMGAQDIIASPEWICEQVTNAVIRHGVNMSIIDPWNQLDHKRKRDEMRDEYTINRIKLIKDTGASLKVAMTIVAHPTAEAGRAAKDGNVISMYDMADGAAWNNAAEYGMIVHRRGMRRSDTICEPYIRKVKFQEIVGCEPGNCAIEYLPGQGRFDTEFCATPIPEDDRDVPYGR